MIVSPICSLTALLELFSKQWNLNNVVSVLSILLRYPILHHACFVIVVIVTVITQPLVVIVKLSSPQWWYDNSITS